MVIVVTQWELMYTTIQGFFPPQESQFLNRYQHIIGK